MRNIRIGMQVKVISGNHKGESGKVLVVMPKTNRIIVQGVNFIKKATRPTQQNPSGGFSEKEASIHISNVMVVQSGKTSRIGYKKLETGGKVRVTKTTGQEIEI
ncbi:50S ribosomal protein L24 [Patescibacteria group bacterium]|nr:50S ribosomal protein L24 [Patescibacteria group bacterium]